MQVRIADKEVAVALKISAIKNNRSIPKENEFLLKQILNIKPKGLCQRK